MGQCSLIATALSMVRVQYAFIHSNDTVPEYFNLRRGDLQEDNTWSLEGLNRF